MDHELRLGPCVSGHPDIPARIKQALPETAAPRDASPAWKPAECVLGSLLASRVGSYVGSGARSNGSPGLRCSPGCGPRSRRRRIDRFRCRSEKLVARDDSKDARRESLMSELPHPRLPPGVPGGHQGFTPPAAEGWLHPGAGGPLRQVQVCAIGEVVVLTAAGVLHDVVAELYQAVLFALAEEPGGVVCALTGGVEGATAKDVGMLASAGRYPRDWPGVPVALACPDGELRAALHRQPLSRHLALASSLEPALFAVRRSTPPRRAALRLPPHPVAPNAARAFVTRTCLDWQLPHSIPAGGLIARELVAHATTETADATGLSLACADGVLRIAVRARDSSRLGPAPSRPLAAEPAAELILVEGLSVAWGTLPAADHGTVGWAVLAA